MLLQVLYSVRSVRQLMEQVQYNLSFRWFVALSMVDAVWVSTVFSKSRERAIASATVTTADGHAEREAAKAMINDARLVLGNDERESTLGADKGCDVKEFIEASVAMTKRTLRDKVAHGGDVNVRL
jgi:hypothetical protein